MDGIIVVNKPKDWTSFDVVAKIRNLTKVKKVGHSGTLDPMATGVLPVFLGRATKSIQHFMGGDKGYIAEMTLGVVTDTLDAEGKIIRNSKVKPCLPAGRCQISNVGGKFNVSLRGEDVRKGQLVLKKGSKIRPQEAAMLATVGRTKVKVFRQPKVAIISTGSEIVEPNKKPGQGKIRNSNSTMLMLQLKRLGIDAKYLGIAKDDFSETERLVKKGLRESDILILSGGVSVGDYDFVAEVLKKCGVKVLFNKIAVKPGKPTTFGVKGRKCIIGLPGNPVSVLVIFELFVVPFIDRIVGREISNKFRAYKLIADFKRRSARREQYYPVVFKNDAVYPIEFHGSAHMQALTRADGIMLVPSGKTFIKKGSKVYARPI